MAAVKLMVVGLRGNSALSGWLSSCRGLSSSSASLWPGLKRSHAASEAPAAQGFSATGCLTFVEPSGHESGPFSAAAMAVLKVTTLAGRLRRLVTIRFPGCWGKATSEGLVRRPSGPNNLIPSKISPTAACFKICSALSHRLISRDPGVVDHFT